MQVNKDNFELLLPRIVNDIKSCDFISIDCEFTGLGLEKSQRNDILDSVQDRYVRVASVASKFLPIQIGIALFSYSPSLERYVAKPYNFYVFPRAGNRQFGLDRSFQCQIGSLEFLESCGFNWNEWIKNGVSFMNKDHEERIKLRLNQQQETDAPLVQGDTLYDFQQETYETVKEFLQKSTKKNIEIVTPSNFHKRIVNQVVQREFSALGCSTKRKFVEVMKLTVEQRQKNLSESRNQVQFKELDQLLGFSKIFNALAEAKKPLVGHNMYLDLCYLYSSFHRKLPENVSEFHKEINVLFPKIYDSKYLAMTNPQIQASIQNTALDHLFGIFQTVAFSSTPVITLDCDFESYGDLKLHEAGFDAYATGVVFLRVLGIHPENNQKQQIDFALHDEFMNKVNMMNSTMSYISISGEVDKPDYSSMFLLSDFPSEWKTGDIQHTFKTLGFFFVKWIDDNNCILILKDKKFVGEAILITERKVKKSSKFVLSKFMPDDVEDGEVCEEPSRKRKRGDDDEGEVKELKSGKQCLVQ